MSPVPKIACFHGGGSNARIFQAQCERLRAFLRYEFEFVYFDAPFERTAGPGVLPYFQKFAPFRSWFKSDLIGQSVADGSGWDNLGTSGIERVLVMMAQYAPLSQWVGVMGFSQGSRVVGGLLLDQQCRIDLGMPTRTNLRFGILCMGSAAPMLSAVSRHTFPASDMGIMEELISIPTLHLHGLKDAQLAPGRKQLATYFDPNTTSILEINYHHAMPWHRRDTMKLVQSIRQMYMDTRQQMSKVSPLQLYDIPRHLNLVDEDNNEDISQDRKARTIAVEICEIVEPVPSDE